MWLIIFIPGGPLITENAQGVFTLVGILKAETSTTGIWIITYLLSLETLYIIPQISSAGLHIQGGGIDCSKYGKKDYQAEENGIWMRVQSFRPWIETRIFEETFPGENLLTSY